MYTKKQRLLALCAFILLVLLLIAFMISAIFNPGGRIFYSLMFSVIALPILSWIYIWLYGKATGKQTMADFHLGQSDEEYRNAKPEETGDASITISKRRKK